MTAQIRPNRMQVNDRFPMLGFAVRTSQPDIQAEVALASAVDLFRSENRARRTAANFYSSREHGLLSVPRGEGVFVVPPEVLARFIGQDKLFFALATGRADQAGLQVDAAPREGSPYVSLTGFTGRTLRRSFAPARADGPPLLEWTGDAAQPGSEPARKAQPAAAGNGRPPAPARPVEYNDGFGELPELPAREARALSGSIGEELELAPAPEPRARAMDGGAAAAIAAASFVIESLVNNQGDVSWEVEQLRGWKHPNDQVPAQRGTVRDGAEIKLDDWPVAGGLVDDISAWFKINWQYDGRSLGNVRVDNTGVNDAVGWGLHVTEQIMHDNITHHSGQVAALRLTFHYRFSRTIGSEVIARRVVTLYGDGSYEIAGDWIQASALGMQAPAAQPEEPRLTPAPQPRARAMDGGNGGSGGNSGSGNTAASAGTAAAGLVLTTLRDNRGDVTWQLDQLRSIKHPGNVAPTNPAPFRNGAEIKLDDWPVAGGLVDDISAWFQIAWQYNGQSIGNIEITNIGVNDAVGWGLDVRARIMDDDRAGPGGSAALRITFYYRFTRSIGSDVLAERTVILHGDGSYEISGDWIQASALGAQATTHERPALAAAY